MSNKKRPVFFFILLIISLLNLSFVSGDFVLNAEESSGEICKGSTLLWAASVTGAGSFTANLEGGASGFSIVVPSGFVSSGSKVVYVYIAPGSRVLAGSYDLKLVVNDGANTKKVPFVINTKDCNSFSLTGDNEKKVCGCESVIYSYKIKNNGQYKDSYYFNLKSEVASWLTLSQDRLDLNPGEEKTIAVTARADCGGFGSYGFTLNADSESKLHMSMDSKLEVENCFDYGFNVDKDYLEMCEHSLENILVGIENTAVRGDYYELSLIGPGWANLESKRITLAAGEAGESKIILNPDYRVEGVFDINLKSKGNRGGVEKEKVIQVKVKKCHDFKLDIVDERARICQGESKDYLVNVANTGETEKEIKLTSDNGAALLNQGILTLKPGESRELNLSLNALNLSAGKYSIGVKGNALDDSNVASADSLEVEVVGRKECYSASVEVSDSEIIRESSGIITLNIRNNGVENGNYEIGLSGNAAGFVQVNPGVVEVKPGGLETLYLHAAPSRLVSYGEYDLNIQVKNTESGIIIARTIQILVKEPAQEEAIAPAPVGEESLWSRLSRWFNSQFGGNVTKKNATRGGLIAPATSSTSTTSSTTSSTSLTTTTLEGTTTSTTLEETTSTLKRAVDTGLPEVDIRYKPVISESVRFTYKNETHTITVGEVGKDSVTVVIESEPVVVVIPLNGSKKVDIDRDGREDIVLQLQNIEDGKPSLEVSAVDYGEVDGGKVSYRNYIIIGIVVLVLIILIAVFALKSEESGLEGEEKEDEEDRVVEKKIIRKEEKKEKERHIEEILEEGDKIPLGRYILLLIIIGAGIWLGFNYSLWDEVLLYKYYVGLGVVVLILVILVVAYWKEIIEFFEEEIEEEEPLSSEKKMARGKEAETGEAAVEKTAEKKKPVEKKKAVRKIKRR